LPLPPAANRNRRQEKLALITDWVRKPPEISDLSPHPNNLLKKRLVRRVGGHAAYKISSEIGMPC